MKIRVYISADPDTSQLFEDVDKVIDGVNDSSGISSERNPKLVLLRKTGNKENLVNGFRQKVGEQDQMETIAVFNLWTFWKLLPDDGKKCEKCGCSIIGDHKNSEGKILCTTCDDKEKWKPDMDQIETMEETLKRIEKEKKEKAGWKADKDIQMDIPEVLDKHKPDKDAKYK